MNIILVIIAVGFFILDFLNIKVFNLNLQSGGLIAFVLSFVA